MEYSQENTSQLTSLPRLEFERKEKLKVFAIFSVKKDLPLEMLKEKCALALIIGYNSIEAIEGAKQGIREGNLNPNDYKTPFIFVYRDLDQVVQMPIKTFELPKPKPVEDIKEKSIQDLAAYVLYVFNKAGTESQKKVARSVITKFKKC